VKEKWVKDTINNKELIGKGASRLVYAIDEETVVKIPRVYEKNIKPLNQYKDYNNSKCKIKLLQNVAELWVWENCPSELRYLLCPVHRWFFVKDLPILFMSRLLVARNELKLKGKNKDKIKNYYGKGRKDDFKKLIKDSRELFRLFGFTEHEMFSPKNWGVENNNKCDLKYLDYGYMKNSIKNIWPSMVRS